MTNAQIAFVCIAAACSVGFAGGLRNLSLEWPKYTLGAKALTTAILFLAWLAVGVLIGMAVVVVVAFK